jgi:type IV secretory pathway TrbD component
MTSRNVCKKVNEPLTVLGVEKRWWYAVVSFAGAVYFTTRSWKFGLVLFVLGEFIGFLLTRFDDKFLDTWRRVFRVKSSYDPVKRTPFVVKVKP